ncbi:restriction endonuclease subunit S [Adhaeribacter swui]|uniref:Restriction endonuclease subunit S n=1 Tax=Adhaeribacter swui TaxID=2086471 RepID=A0A7G7G523_9BACT|nr:restriction endonuclease subunit S [Adhaeribacter swui]QNF32257.1 restriction endonuclease subunit S [Adhaeribacter swui]
MQNNKLVPKLRFPEFENEEDWEEKFVGDVYEFRVTNSFSRENLNYEKGYVKNIHYGDIHTKFNTLFDIAKEKVPFINPDVPIDKIKEENYCIEGDIIFADASEDLNDIGKSIEIVSLENEQLVSGLHTLLARQKENKLFIGFGGYLFKSHTVRQQIQKEAQGAKVLGISAARISKVKISYPKNLKEQQKIASCLSSLDELIAAHSQKLEALKAHKKGLMQNLFPQEGETVPKCRFPEFANDGEWEKSLLGKLGKFLGGGTPERSNNNYWIGRIPWISSSDIGEDNIHNISITRFINELAVKESATKIIPRGSILFVSRVGVGKLAINQQELCTSQDYTNFIPYTILNYFIGYYFSANKHLLQTLNQGTSIKGFSKADLENIELYYPKSKKEQQRIADCLSALDALITAQVEKIEQLKLHKKGLMQGLFPKVIE